VRMLNPVFGVLAALAAAALFSSSAAASSITYDLVTGELTSVTVDGGVNLLESPVTLDSASLTADFTSLDLDNLFISATGPGVIQLSPTESIVFSNATLQSAGVGNLTINGSVYNFDTTATVAADLDDGSGSTTAFTTQSGVAGSIRLGTDGLIVTLEGVVLPSVGDQLVKADFQFTARSLGGETAIPEPGSQLLFPAGLALLGWAIRRR